MNRWKIVYKQYCKAVEMIYSAVQPYLPYVLVCDTNVEEDYNIIYLEIDSSIAGFRINVSDPREDRQRINITAKDEVNLMYAASDFKNVYLPYAGKVTGDNVIDFYCNKLFEGVLRPFDYGTAPRIKRRGLWTWGHTIYDYKKYIDNMVILKLNTLIVWNDFVPVNIGDVIAYAHRNGISIYLGFAWGWDTNFVNMDISDTSRLTKSVVKKYINEYKELECDGIYFQSFTELSDDTIGGVSIAEAVTEFVNNTVNELYNISPDLDVLFGLHATSVIDKIDVFKKLDSRISVIWEDMGAFPYANSSDDLSGFEKTAELNRKAQSLRTGGFGAVLKSNYRLDWSSFEHQQGRFIMGVSDRRYIKKKSEYIKPLLKTIQADWIKNAPYACELIRDFDENAIVTVLAEDGVFEEFITYPVALYAQMMWDSSISIDEIMHTVAEMPDVDFV